MPKPAEKKHWMKFYPGDWRADPRLRICSLAARGLWMEMLGLMHEAKPYGHLIVNGLAVSDTQLAALVGAPPDQVCELLAELDAAGVFSRTKQGVIYSRRMTRDGKKSRISRQNGQNGGNPTLRKQKENPPWVKGADKGRDNTHMLEARVQKEESLSPNAGAREGPEVDRLDHDATAGAACFGSDVEFPAFWHAYPHKTNQAAARAAFAKARRIASLSEIVLGAERYAASLQGPGAPHPMNPDRWLDKERWTDQPLEQSDARRQSARPAKPIRGAAVWSEVVGRTEGRAGHADEDEPDDVRARGDGLEMSRVGFG